MNNLTDKTVMLLNIRIKNEEMSSRLYLQMSNELNYCGYAGAAKLWKKYSDEELHHACLTYNLLLDLDYLPEVPALDKPKQYNCNFVEILKASYEHEQLIATECKQLYIETQKEGDILAMQFAEFLVKEQVEELAKTKYWLDRLEAFGISKEALRLLDNEMMEMAK